MRRSIQLGDRTVVYELTRKPVKNVNIRVRADGSVGVSAGRWVTVAQIEEILQGRAAFLLRALETFAAMEDKRPKHTDYADGSIVYLLGQPHRVVLSQAEKNGVRREGEVLHLSLKEPDNIPLRVRTMESFLKAQCLEAATAFCQVWQPKMAPLGIPFPQIRVRSMTSRWGTCKPTAGQVTFARQLVEAPPDCMEYVVCHELVHFLHPNHSQAFYACLEGFLPDWRARRERLNSYSYR